jgi:hypothetical protein
MILGVTVVGRHVEKVSSIPNNWIGKKIAQECPQLGFPSITNISEWTNIQGQKSLNLVIDWAYAYACEVEI